LWAVPGLRCIEIGGHLASNLRATPLSAYIRLIYWRHTFLPQTYDAWVNGAGTPNNFAGAIMKKVVALRQTEKPPTPVMVKAFLGLCRLGVRPGMILLRHPPRPDRAGAGAMALSPRHKLDMSLLLPVRNYALRAVRSV